MTILKKELCMGILRASGVDPVVALRLRNAADYCLPTFGSHGTKLGSDLSGWFDNCIKSEVSWQIEWMWG